MARLQSAAPDLRSRALQVDMSPNLAQHDKIPKKIAKYLDQALCVRPCWCISFRHGKLSLLRASNLLSPVHGQVLCLEAV